MLTWTPEENISYVQQVSTLLNNAGATLKLKKGVFLANTMDYFGHVLHSRRFEIASHTTDATSGLKAPTLISELQSFLGL